MAGGGDRRALPPACATGVALCLAFALGSSARADSTPMCFGSPATIVGTAGNDVLTGTEGPDVIVGGAGNDTIQGLGGDDKICGGDGNDTIDSGAGNDIATGENGDDTVAGGAGDDTVYGKAGNRASRSRPAARVRPAEPARPQAADRRPGERLAQPLLANRGRSSPR